MSIPTYSLFVVAPLNVLFNYLFVSPFPSFVQSIEESELITRCGDPNPSDLDSLVEL